MLARRAETESLTLLNPRSRTGLGFALAAMLSGCSPAPPPSSSPTPAATTVTHVSVNRSSPTPAVERNGMKASDVAWEYAEQGKQRLEYMRKAPEGNGYDRLVGLKASKNGLLELSALAEKEGPKRLFQVLDGPAGKKGGQLYKDYGTIWTASSYRHLAAPVEVPKTGVIPIPDSEKFVKVTTAMLLIPRIETRNPNHSDKLDTLLKMATIARTISLGAPTVEHYAQGTALQMEALNGIASVYKSGKLKPERLREQIASLQVFICNQAEMQPILDTEYVMAQRRLESAGLTPPELEKEKEGLAAKFLALRPLFGDPKAAEKAFKPEAKIPELVGCKLANKELEFSQALAHSRLALTQLGAVELLAALEVYHGEKKSYPDSLEELVPSVLSRMPTDWFSKDGKFVYHRKDKGYTLESVSAALPRGRVAW